MSDLNLEGLSDKQLRLFAVRCARRVQHLMTDPRSISALDVADRYAQGEATDDELSAARAAAAAAWGSDNRGTRGAAMAASWAAARDARDAAWASGAAARAAAAAAWDAELAEQQKILDEIRQEQPR
jgi:hypothetical protein